MTIKDLNLVDANEITEHDQKITLNSAQKIVDFRKNYGNYKTFDDLLSIHYFGKKKISSIIDKKKFYICTPDEGPSFRHPPPFRRLVPSFDKNESSLNEENDLYIIHVNIRSLSKNIDKLKSLIASQNRKPDVICLSEVGIKESANNCIDIENYSLYENPAENDNGGVAIYVAKKFDCKQIAKDSDEKHFEILFVKIKLPDDKEVVVGAVYRHPKHETNKDVDEFVDNLLTTIKKLKQHEEYLYLLGDVNVNLLKCNEKVKKYCDHLFDLQLHELITHPTRVTENSSTLIDHIYTNNIGFTESGVILTKEISDHYPIYCRVEAWKKKRNPKQLMKVEKKESKATHESRKKVTVVEDDENVTQNLPEKRIVVSEMSESTKNGDAIQSEQNV